MLIDHTPTGKGTRCDKCREPRQKHRVKHEFLSACCLQCGKPSHEHKAAHPFQGPITMTKVDGVLVDTCLTCGLPKKNHRERRRSPAEIEARKKTQRILVSVDTEGCGRWPHRSVMICWRDERGERYGCREDEGRLTSDECLDFLVDLPGSPEHGGKNLPGDNSSSKVTTFAFSFRYDLAKILTDLPNSAIYQLMRPDIRRIPGSRQLRQVEWQSGSRSYQLDYYGGKFIVSRHEAAKVAKKPSRRARWHEWVPGKRAKRSKNGKDLGDVVLCEICGRPREHEKHVPKGKHAFKKGKTIGVTVDGKKALATELCFHCGRQSNHKIHAVAAPEDWTTRSVWDVFSFYQSAFVAALETWKTTDEETLRRVTEMKAQRGAANWMRSKAARDEARRYCLDECQLLSKLMRQFLGACERAEIDLEGRYHGAGSLGSAMLKSLGIDWHLKDGRKHFPKRMIDAIERAYFGGRFEHSVLGPVDGPIYGFDISSAYPYRIFQLPCLVHGRWRYVRDRSQIEGSREITKYGEKETVRVTAALVHYGLGDDIDDKEPWGPFPFRSPKGGITFPLRSPGGWVWRDEFLAGEKAFPHVYFRGAWICESSCDCQPFAKVPKWYLHRLLLGKEGPGLVLKSGVNSIYGQTARSVGGGGRYQCWPWASIITSGCRAQVLEAIALHKDRHNLLAVATDGIYTRERLALPAPLDTGTDRAKRSPTEIAADKRDDVACKHCGAVGCEWAHKPLGGWEETVFPRGMFFIQPGVYTPLHPDKKMSKKLRARGIGRIVLRDHWRQVLAAWRAGKTIVHLKKKGKKDKGLERFVGAKTGIYAVPARQGTKAPKVKAPGTVEGPLPCPRTDHRYDDPRHVCSTCHNAYAVYYVRAPTYGEWVTREVDLALAATPKRREFGRRIKGESGTHARLLCWSYVGGPESTRYSRAVVSAEARALQDFTEEMLEQPDGDYSEEYDE